MDSIRVVLPTCLGTIIITAKYYFEVLVKFSTQRPQREDRSVRRKWDLSSSLHSLHDIRFCALCVKFFLVAVAQKNHPERGKPGGF
jgi:DMSO reductase anchor subunit